MNVLDTTSYPHILDSIIENAPRAALVRLRAVSRDFRRSADALLRPERLVVTAGPVGGKASVALPNGRLLGANGVPDERDLAYVQAVDVVGTGALGTAGTLLRTMSEPRRLTLRFMHNPLASRDISLSQFSGRGLDYIRKRPVYLSLPPILESAVFFIPFPHLFWRQRALLPRYITSQTGHSALLPLGESAALQRTVFNISIHPDDTYIGKGTYWGWEKFVNERVYSAQVAVFVFQRAAQSTSCHDEFDDEDADVKVSAIHELLGALELLISHVVNRHAQTVVIVNAEVADDMYPLETRDSSFEYLRSKASPKYKPSSCEGTVRFMSLEAYRDLVVPLRAALETTADGSVAAVEASLESSNAVLRSE